MAVEIERKFLLRDEGWRRDVSRSVAMRQGYLAAPPAARCTVRVRIGGGHAFLTVKSVATAIRRDEYEYAIPPGDAARMLATLAGDVIEKRRHFVEVHGHVFEIDEFAGANRGLVVAELELAAPALARRGRQRARALLQSEPRHPSLFAMDRRGTRCGRRRLIRSTAC